MDNTRKKFNFFNLFPVSQSDYEWIEGKINEMSIEEKCAQLIFPGVFGSSDKQGSELNNVVRLVKDKKVGGVILFEGYLDEQIELINKLQEISETPLLVAADFERGLGMRLKDAPEYPYAMAVAATGNPNFAYLMGKSIGIQSRAMGVFQNYAPVADVNSNSENPIVNTRAFSDEKKLVIRFATEFIKGTNDSGIIATVKHFPGHGSSEADSHMDIAQINLNKKILFKGDLAPFIEAIKAGVKSVMIGHLEVSSLEEKSGLPASLSKKVINDLLIEEMGFEGLIVSDAMDMSAVTKYFHTEEASILAINAGTDLLTKPEDVERTLHGLVKAVEKGEIKISRIENSVRKLLCAKKFYSIEQQEKYEKGSIEKLYNNKSHLRLINEVSERSITLLRNTSHVIPLERENYFKVLNVNISDDNFDDKQKYFDERLKCNLNYLKSFYVNHESEESSYLEILNEAKDSELILVPVFIKVKPNKGTVSFTDEEMALLNGLRKINRPLIIIFFGNPYLVSALPDGPSLICAYGDSIASQEAVIKALFGEVDITGKLPITIPGTNYSLGSGMNLSKNKSIYNEEEVSKYYDFSKMETLIEDAIKEEIFPGAAMFISHQGKTIFNKYFGNHTFAKNSSQVTPKTLFDIDNLTQIFTLYAVLLLIDYNHLNPDERIGNYLISFADRKLSSLKLHDLLNEKFKINLFDDISTSYSYSLDIVDRISKNLNKTDKDEEEIQSGIKSVILQNIIEKVSLKNLDVFIKENILYPLNLEDTFFNPSHDEYSRCAPTNIKFSAEKPNQGVVFNEDSYKMGGIAGFAGIFTTINDMAKILQVLIQNGVHNNFRLLRASIVENLFYQQRQVIKIIGKTGASLFIDRKNKLSYILLTNSCYKLEDFSKFKKFDKDLEWEIQSLIKYDF